MGPHALPTSLLSALLLDFLSAHCANLYLILNVHLFFLYFYRPTKEYIEEQREYESVLYDGRTLKEMIEFVEKAEREKEEVINKTEQKIRENLAKQEAEIKAWQRRVETRNVQADKERLKRQQILDEVNVFSNINFSGYYLI